MSSCRRQCCRRQRRRSRSFSFLTEVVPDVLSLKISQSGDADLWKIIEVGQDMDVNVLCRDLCGAFALEDMADYLLSVPDRNGFPLEYSANGSKRSLNKANGKMLQELPPFRRHNAHALPHP
mgnify:CR=1 FL=1